MSPLPAPALEEGIGESELHTVSVTCETTLDESIQTLLRYDPVCIKSKSFGDEQRQDPEVMEIIQFLEIALGLELHTQNSNPAVPVYPH